jgi:hypothetical protein
MTFSEYLPRISPDAYPEEELLDALGKALRSHLKRMDLWDHSPEYLGYFDFRTWPEAFAGGDATADPTLDCYLDAIVRRYSSLMDHLMTRKANVDGLVHLNIRRFILERQKSHDPVGYAVFKNLEAALQDLIAAGTVQDVQSGSERPGKLRNRSLLAFGGEVPAQPASRETIEAALDDPAWVTTLPRLSKLGKGAQRLLRECLVRLPAAGVQSFALGELVGPLKVRARAVHARRNLPPGDEVIPEGTANDAVRELIRIVRPEAGYEEQREPLERLLRCVEQGIARGDFQGRTREGLERLLQELRQYAGSDEDIPSWAELARQLGARRATVWDHVARLRVLVQDCRK